MSCDLIIIDGWICEQVSTGGMLELCMRQCLESIYPNYPDHQRWLERQARDVLLCRFSGDWLRMKHEFLEPAAELIGRLHHICHQSRFHVSFNSLWFFVWNNLPFEEWSLVSTQNIPENFISLGQFALKWNQFYSNLITNWPIYKFQFITDCYRRGLLNEPVYSLRKSFDQLGRCRPFVDWWRGQWPRSSLTAGGNKFTCCRVCLI